MLPEQNYCIKIKYQNITLRKFYYYLEIFQSAEKYKV